MKIHEYQARDLLIKYGVPVPTGGRVFNQASLAGDYYTAICKEAGVSLCVIKAQVHAGGRGKGGGVKLVRSAEEATAAATAILSKPLITPQTGPEGVPVNNLLIVPGVDIAKEYYVAVVVDRAAGRPVLIASSEGGMEIEEVAKTNPEAILREPIDPDAGLGDYQTRKVAFAMGFKGKQVGQAGKVMKSLAKLFLAEDASLAEINPLIVTPPTDAHPDGEVLALDAKVTFDENALFRHKDLLSLEDPEDIPEAEERAQKFGLSYIQLEGEIGCLVNGAGLAMATMDLVKLHGKQPANFLDVGGSATEEAVTEAFRIILSDKKVKGVLVNIFGGIAKCDTIANAIVAAAKEVGFEVPLVVRLEGTNVEPARIILEKAKADIPTMETGKDLTDAAKKIAAAVA